MSDRAPRWTPHGQQGGSGLRELDGATELEALGGTVIELKPSDWRALAA
jgi:hypothetical protein